MQGLKKFLCSAGVFLVSFLLICLWGKFSPEAFVIDDNRTQWFPVIDKAYSDFFRTGSMPIYDFYQLKGLAIAEPGYYSIMNPLMVVSYALSHFTPLHFSTLTMHIMLLFSLGNVVFFWLCHTLGRKLPECIIYTAAYSVTSSFFGICYWYYVFNNYLFVPLLIYVFIKTQGKWYEFVGCGLVLGLDIFFGNVQYTCYHYMVYGILCVLCIAFKSWRHIGVFFSNVATAVVLSSPILLLTLRASDSFATNDFRGMGIPLREVILGAFVPSGILGVLEKPEPAFTSNLITRRDYTWLFNGAFASFWVVVIIGIVVLLIKKPYTIDLKKWYQEVCKDKQRQLTVGLFVCLIFYFSFVSNGFVAFILSKLPVIKKFRFLFKTLLVIGPLVAIFTAAFSKRLPKKLHVVAMGVCSVFIVLGIVNNYCATTVVTNLFSDKISMSFEEEQEKGQEVIDKTNWDTGLYRYATFLKNDSGVPRETFHYYNGYLRNFATTMEIYSLGAYEIAANGKHLDRFSALYEPWKLYTRMVNVGVVDRVVWMAENDPYSIDQTLLHNAVKYLFVQRAYPVTPNPTDDPRDYTAEVVDAINKLDVMSVVDVYPANDYFDVVVLDGMYSLCRDDQNEIPIVNEQMDMVSFESTGAEEYTISFAYDDHLKAYLSNNDTLTELETEENGAGNTVIHAPAGQSGTIYFTYEDKVCSFGFGAEIVVTIWFIALMVVIGMDKGDKPMKKSEKIKNMLGKEQTA